MTTIQSILAEQRSSSTSAARRSRMTERPSTDWFLIAIVIVLLLLGLVMAYSTTFYRSAQTEGSPFAIFSKQLVASGLGLGMFVILSRVDYGFWRRWSLALIALSVVTLLAVLAFGDTILGAKRTFLHGSLQPSEPIKILILLYGATWLASRREQVTSFTNGLVPFAVIVGITAALIAAQPDISTSAVLLLAASAMFFMAGANLFHIGLVGGSAVAGFYGLIKLFPHAAERWNQFVNSLSNPQDTAYHIQQSILAFGGGGIWGSGIGAGNQKFILLPFPHTDSVFAVLAEEMGLLGVVVTLGLFVLLAYRSFRIAQKADNAFGAFWAIGLITWIMMQALLNLLAMTGLIPLPGVPVPFLSVGGSSMVSVLAACGILVSISRGSNVLSDQDNMRSTLGDDPRGGKSDYSANSNISRRNSRPRPTRPNRAQGTGVDATTDIIGRDVKFTPRLSKKPPEVGKPGSVRWRTGRYGTGSGYTRGR
jgi:cell division protein FtsW